MRRFDQPMILLAAFVGVALVTSDVQAQGRGAPGAAFLIGTPEVQEDLKLTDQQKQEVNKVREDTLESLRALRDIEDREERSNKSRELNEQAEAAIKKILDEEQQKRFAQILLQQAGRANLPGTLLRDAVASQLKLTGEQKTKLEGIQTEADNARRELRQGFQGASQEERREIFGKMREISEQANEKALAALTSEQKEAWTALLGKPLEIQFRGRRGGGNS